MAVFELTEKSEIALVFFVGDAQTRDCMGLVLRDAADQPWYLRYRFRYYDVPDRAGDPDAPDTKNVYEVKPNVQGASEDVRLHLETIAREMATLLKTMGFGNALEIHEVHGNAEAFQQKVQGSAFMHARYVGPDAPGVH